MKQKFNWGNLVKLLVYWIVIVGFILTLRENITDFSKIAEILRAGDYSWLFISFVIESVILLLYAYIYYTSLAISGVSGTFFSELKKFLSMFFFTVATPLGGSGSVIYYSKIFTAGKHTSFSKGLLGILMAVLFVNFGAIPVLLYCLLTLKYSGSVWFSVASGAVLLLGSVNLLMLGAVALAANRPILFKKASYLLHRLLSIFKLAGPLGFFDQKIERNIHDFCLSAKSLSHAYNKPAAYFAILLSGLYHVVHILLLFSVTRAFGIYMDPRMLITTYASFYLFTIVSPTPQGIGVAETLVQHIMKSIGVVSEEAVIVTLAYRALSLWVPILVGFFLFKGVNKELGR